MTQMTDRDRTKARLTLTGILRHHLVGDHPGDIIDVDMEFGFLAEDTSTDDYLAIRVMRHTEDGWVATPTVLTVAITDDSSDDK